MELLTIRIRLIVCSIDKAEQIGLDWWKYDQHLAPGSMARAETERLRVQVEAMEAGDVGSVRKNVEAKLATSEDKLRRYERTREFLLDGRSEEAFLAEEARIGPYLTLLRGIAFERENLTWCELVLEKIPGQSQV